jgi:Uma2 family endonuclease
MRTYRNDKLVNPRVKHWTQREFDECVGRGFLDVQTTLCDGSIFCKSSNGEQIPKRWTKAEYNKKVERGFLVGQRVFLNRGELIEMSVMSYEHAQCCNRIAYWLFDTFRHSEYAIRGRCPLEVPGDSMPEPDASLVTPLQAKHFPHPNGAAFVIEVSEDSAAIEREFAFDYAAAQVPEYWIVHSKARCVEILRDPVTDFSSGTGFRFASQWVVGEGESISPIIGPNVRVQVSRLFVEKA